MNKFDDFLSDFLGEAPAAVGIFNGLLFSAIIAIILICFITID